MKVRLRVDWADIDVDEPVNDVTCVDLGGSVGIEYPQEEEREEQWRAEDDEAEHRERQGMVEVYKEEKKRKKGLTWTREGRQLTI